MKKRIVPGVSDFKTLIEGNYYYVDKTLLIKDIIENGQIILATRPRRFGKTLNLSMLKYFFEHSEQKNDHLFRDKNIWKEGAYKDLQGAFPVIFITFKAVNELTWDATYTKSTLLIADEFGRHSYLLKKGFLQSSERERYDMIVNRRAPQADFESSLNFLAELLARYYQKKVVVLIDEYDTPLQSSYIHSYYDKALDFFRGLLVAVLKDSTILEIGVLTGVATLAKADIFTGLNNLSVFNLTESKLADKFGFTQEETQALLEYYQIDEGKTIQEWYNGYVFGANTEIFNPWSVMKCVEKNGALETYWSNTSENLLVKRLIGHASVSLKIDLGLLLQNIPVSKAIDESITFPDLERRSEHIWTLLLFTGYITYSSYQLVGGRKVCQFRIPNAEVHSLYNELLKNILKESVSGEKVDDLFQAILQGDTEIFTELLQSFIITSTSSFDLPKSEPERSYHLFVLGILVSLKGYEVKPNRESGLGRYDIMLIPHDSTKPAAIIEFKKVRKTETLETAAQRALDQIVERKYAHELTERGIKSIIAYGTALDGKDLYIKELWV